ncbi:hypothetical protein [Halomonas lysinitropha]|uniref:Uncharacterized protein n=1 Tax=Halomonas lysinitropha TaxID=2607506 RepID=A0A5K1I8B8_9GAMM|nr:hypothetical protein [Halomonas lysinitropha]VVZ96150.1 hypothetical protein HALO32_02246 [Halomonas lysinitropha]
MRQLDPTRKLDTAAERPDHTAMPRFCMPAMPPLGLVASIENRLRAWRQGNHQRTH